MQVDEMRVVSLLEQIRRERLVIDPGLSVYPVRQLVLDPRITMSPAELLERTGESIPTWRFPVLMNNKSSTEYDRDNVIQVLVGAYSGELFTEHVTLLRNQRTVTRLENGLGHHLNRPSEVDLSLTIRKLEVEVSSLRQQVNAIESTADARQRREYIAQIGRREMMRDLYKETIDLLHEDRLREALERQWTIIQVKREQRAARRATMLRGDAMLDDAEENFEEWTAIHNRTVIALGVSDAEAEQRLIRARRELEDARSSRAWRNLRHRLRQLFL
ncbi:hypothetical protein B7Y92_02870 [Candidatus Saccharibacteria bacterium 32-50-13]|nr:MAG: hypothetical protein B7Y92_02870 [Candidatus Saccharibacteria bacterium 32-50-13]